MAETIAETNGIPDSSTMSTLESTTQIPIAQLTPSLPAPASRSVKAVVTLTWPYSSRTGSVAFLLAEPDFRLRRTRGQVRVQFSGSSANIIAKSGIASGDEVILCLDGVEYIEPEATNATPGRGVEFELKFTERLLLQFRPEDSQEVKFINIDHPAPEPVPTPAPAAATDIDTEYLIPEVPATPTPFSNRLAAQNVEEYVSPVFLKRERTSYGSMFAEGYDPFEVEDGSVRGKGRKRTRLSTSWRFTSRSLSPSPEVEEPVASSLENGIQELANKHAPAMTDESVQTMEVESKVTAEAKQTLDQIHPRITEENETNGITKVVPAEARLQQELQVGEKIANTMPPPQKQSDNFSPEIDHQGTSSDDIVEKLPSSPQLRPLSSEGLPLVSPLVANRVDVFNNPIHNDNTQDLKVADVPDVLPTEADRKIQFGDKDEDLYDACPPRHTSDQLNSDQSSHQTSTIPSGNKYGSLSMESIFTPHQQSQSEAEQGSGQLFPLYNVSGPDPYKSASSHNEISAEHDQYIPIEMEESMAQYNYPDPEQMQPQSNNWETQRSMTYPDPEDRHQQSANHSPYPQPPSVPFMARSQSNQSNQSHQSRQSQIVDLTESDDENEDAEGSSEVEDNRQQHMSNSHLPVDSEEEAFYDEDEEDERSISGDENQFDYNTPRDVPEGDDYGDDYDDEYGDGYEEGYSDEDEQDNYSDDGMNKEAPLQQQPPGAPEVIDLLSSDDEDEEPAAATETFKSRLGTTDIQIKDDVEYEQETEEEEDEDEDEDKEGLDVGGEEVQNTGMSTTKSREFVRELSSESDEGESTDNESPLAEDSGGINETNAEIPETIANESESGLDIQMEVDANPDESKDAKNSSQKDTAEEEDAAELVSESMNIENSSAYSSAITDRVDADSTTDNLDGLFGKLEEAGSEAQFEQGLSNIEGGESQKDMGDLENDVEKTGIEEIVQDSNKANTSETPSQESDPTETIGFLPTAEDVLRASTLTVDENSIDSALENSLPVSVNVEASGEPTISSPEKQQMIEQAVQPGLYDSPPKALLFSKFFGLDGANDTSDAGDEDNQAQVQYRTLPVAKPEDQKELFDEPEKIPQTQNSTDSMDITTNHLNNQLPTPDDTQKMILDNDSSTSISDLLQSQLQEEMGEDMDEDSEMIQTDESIEKNSSKDSIEDEIRISAQEEINEDQNGATDTEAMDQDDDDVIDPELEDFKVEITETEITEVQKTESTETEVERAEENLLNDDVVEDEQSEVEPDEAEEFGYGKSELERLETNIRTSEITEIEAQQILAELANKKNFGKDREMIEVEEQKFLKTFEETETTIDETETVILEQKGGALPVSAAPLRSDNRKKPSPASRRGKKELTSVGPRQTRSSKEPSPEVKKSRKGSATISPRQTRSKKLEPAVEIGTPITPTTPNQENMRPSTRGSNCSRRSPSIILDEEETPRGHDASAEMALESLNLPESPTKAGHHLRAPACTDPKLRLTKYLRTDLSEYTTLKMLRFKMTSKLDILAIATSAPPDPQRAKSGPRHYTITFTITDQTIAPSGVVEVNVFRPYKDALPTPEIGDGILLRDFSVLSVKGKGFALRSEEGSSWAVFKDEGTEVEVRGPPVEYGHGEKKHMKELREWFHALDDDQKTKLEKASKAMERSSVGNGTPEKGKK